MNQLLLDIKQKATILEIVEYPNPVLSQKAEPVKIFDENLKQLAINMLKTMYQAPGIGLACPQVNISQRMFVIDTDFKREEMTNSEGRTEYQIKDQNPYIFINPEYKALSSEKIKYEEGCLSLPGIYDEVMRFKEIIVTFQDLEGKKCELKADGLLSICIQHENDHLDGVVFIERMSMLKKNFYKKKVLKQKQK